MSICIIVQRDDNSRNDHVCTISGLAKTCGDCKKNSMELILQEPCLANDYLTGWWYCVECDTTAKLRVDSSMFM